MNAARWSLPYCLALAIVGAWPASADQGPPLTTQAFMDRFTAAINAKDKHAVDALVYWGKADSWSRDMTETILSVYEAETITSAHLAPLDSSSDATMPGPNGKTYGPSLKPVYKVVVEYAHGPHVTQDEGSFVIGTQGGAWYIVAIAPQR